MKKKMTALLCLLALAVSLCAPMAKAEEAVFFTAMGESILPLTDETMPFLSGSQIYIPADLFTGTVRRQLDVSYTYNKSENLVILYRGSQSLWFYLDRDLTRDHEDNIYYSGAIVKNGVVFVSASMVARFFELTYTVTEVPHGYMVWFRKAGYPLSDAHFADAASYSMDSRYAAYLKVRQEQAQREPDAPQTPVMEGRSVCLALAAGELTGLLLDTLEHHGAEAAVFFTPEQMTQMGGTLRRMAVRGHSSGIFLPEGTADLTAAAEEANRALENATCGRTRLVWAPGAAQAQLEQLRAAGYRTVSFDAENAALRTAAQAKGLMQRISQSDAAAAVWLGSDVSTAGLGWFVRSVQEAEGRCRALTELN